jgi:catechol 2,3-dioxygenase-like lactoylglutathione lyase family enzyme
VKDTTTFKVLAVDHVDVTAPAELMDDVLAWYRDVLGLTLIDKPAHTRPGGGWFRAGPQEVHVSLDQHNPHKSAHFGIVVDDFEAVIDRLRSAGCHIEQASSIPGRHRCFTRDPAGNRIEIAHVDTGGVAG